MSRLTDIKDALVTALAGINGTSPYTYDLSATGAVFVASGFPDGAPQTCVWLFPGPIETEAAGIGIATLAQWSRRQTWGINGFVPGAADTPDARIEAANALFDDIWHALHVDRQLGGNVIEMVLSEVLAFDGTDAGFAGRGVVSMTATLTWRAGLTTP